MDTRTCKTCGVEKPLESFPIKGRGRYEKYRSYVCKECRRIVWKNKEAEKRAVLSQIKHDAGCYFCGYRNPVALDFHHTDPTTKKFTIAKEQSNQSLGRLLDEAAKCVVVCANCHRELHAGQRAFTVEGGD